MVVTNGSGITDGGDFLQKCLIKERKLKLAPMYNRSRSPPHLAIPCYWHTPFVVCLLVWWHYSFVSSLIV